MSPPDGICALDVEEVGVKGGQQLGQVPGNEGPSVLIRPQPEVECRVQVDAGLPRRPPLLGDVGRLPRLVDYCGDDRGSDGTGIDCSVCHWVIACSRQGEMGAACHSLGMSMGFMV